jgi:hypothetical protein
LQERFQISSDAAMFLPFHSSNLHTNCKYSIFREKIPHYMSAILLIFPQIHMLSQIAIPCSPWSITLSQAGLHFAQWQSGSAGRQAWWQAGRRQCALPLCLLVPGRPYASRLEGGASQPEPSAFSTSWFLKQPLCMDLSEDVRGGWTPLYFSLQQDFVCD